MLRRMGRFQAGVAELEAANARAIQQKLLAGFLAARNIWWDISMQTSCRPAAAPPCARTTRSLQACDLGQQLQLGSLVDTKIGERHRRPPYLSEMPAWAWGGRRTGALK